MRLLWKRRNYHKRSRPAQRHFSKPRPANLITVPACLKCHSQQTSKDDEYFRNALNVREDLSHHRDVLKAQPIVMRSLLSPHKAGMLAEFLGNIRLIEYVTPAGIFIKQSLGIQQDLGRIRQVVQRTLLGLFYHHKQHRLPTGYETLIFNEESFQNWPAKVLDLFREKVIRPLLAQKAITIGNGVFSYRFGFSTADHDTTYWIFIFYGRESFFGITQPSIEKI